MKRHPSRLVPLLVGVLSCFVIAPSVLSQERPTRRSRKPDLPEKRDVSLLTRDRVKLKASYYASTKGKEAIPIMLVHEWGGQASPYNDLAVSLQKEGYAVLIPEYRGHGASKSYTDRSGRQKDFETDRMGRRDVEAVIMADLESAKGFLKEENNEEKLNLNALVLLGVREGCLLAAHWAQRDWAFPSVGAKKQGQDVKALIFVSPVKTFKGVAMDRAIRDFNILNLPIMVVAGKGSKESPEASRIIKQLKTAKGKLNRTQELDDLIPVAFPKSLSGQELANAIKPMILRFTSEKVVVENGLNEWVDRK